MLSHTEESAESFDRISALIDEATTIAICAHVNPDGDALGSALGLTQIIQGRWTGKEIVNFLADDASVPRIYQFLPGADRCVRACNYSESRTSSSVLICHLHHDWEMARRFSIVLLVVPSSTITRVTIRLLMPTSSVPKLLLRALSLLSMHSTLELR